MQRVKGIEVRTYVLNCNNCILEILNTFQQHSQLTAWYCPLCPQTQQVLKLIKILSHVPSPPFLSCSQKLEHVFRKLVSMALRETDKREFFQWMMNCL